MVFLKTEGFAGVERGVGGVEVPSNSGVVFPVLLPSFGDAASVDVISADGAFVSFDWSLLGYS